MTVAAVADGPGEHPDVVTLRAGRDGVAHGRRISQLLRPTKSPDEARALLPRLYDYLPPAEDVTAASMTLRMGRATPAQLRALIAPGGVSICETASGNRHPHSHTCRLYHGAQLTDAVLDRLPGGFTDWDDEERPPNRMWADDVHCSSERRRTTCSANTGGPAFIVWTYQGQGASLRLLSVDVDVFEDS